MFIDVAAACEIYDLIENVETKVQGLKLELTESMNHLFANIDADFDRVTSWKDDVTSLREELDDLASRFHQQVIS